MVSLSLNGSFHVWYCYCLLVEVAVVVAVGVSSRLSVLCLFACLLAEETLSKPNGSLEFGFD